MVSVDQLMILALHGTVLGMIYVILSLGLTIVFGIGGVVNFAHGSFFMLGGYSGWLTLEHTGSFVLAAVASVVVVGLLGGIFEIVLLRPISDRDVLYQVLVTFGAVLVIDSTVQNVFGGLPKTIRRPDFLSGPLRMGDIIYPRYRLFLIVVGAVLTVLVWLFLKYTDYGVRLRGATFDSEMTQALGTNTKLLFTATFMVGAGLAGLAGLLASPILTISPHIGKDIIVLVFMIVIIGGFGSFKGAILGSFVIGYAQVFNTVVLSEVDGVLIYVVFVVVMLTFERGFFGREMEA